MMDTWTFIKWFALFLIVCYYVGAIFDGLGYELTKREF